MKSIFISSTFKDMHAERDMLNIDVFPEISEFIREYGEELSFIDLRWGINTQALEDDDSTHKILSVCLDEIDYSKPYLIAFLGERYGWIPDKKLIENAVKQKPSEFSYLAELEKSVTALEIEYGALSQKSSIDHCLFYFREPIQTEKLNQEQISIYCSEGAEYKRRLEALKSQIINSGGKVTNYTANWDEENNCITGLDKLKNQISCDLRELIIKDYGQKKQLPWQDKEIMEAELFFREKLACFSARATLFDEITDKIFSDSTKLIIIKGQSGFGKSTMMAKLAANAKDRKAHVLPIVCGQSKNISHYNDIQRQILFYLEGLLELREHLGGEEFENQRRSLSVNWVEEITKKICQCKEKLTDPIVILIDGVNKLSSIQDFQDFFRRLLWKLPKNIIFVLSCVDDFEIPEKLDEKIKCSVYTLDALDENEKKLVLKTLEGSNYQKELVSEVKNKLLSMKQASNPFYLSVMYQRMIMLDSSDFREILRLGDGLQGQTEYMLHLIDDAPRDIDGVCAMIMEEAASRINMEQCNEVLRLIAVSHGGLRERDLQYIFKQRNAEYNTRDSSRLFKYMRPYFLKRHDGRITFSYESFPLGIQKKLTESQLKQLNEEISTLLESLSSYDPVHRAEYTWFQWKCDKKTQFLKRLLDYNKISPIIDTSKGPLLAYHSPAKVILDICRIDNGEWLINLLKSCTEPVETHLLLRILRIDLLVYFDNSVDNIMVLISVMEQALQTAEYIAKECGTSEIKDDLRQISCIIGDLSQSCNEYDKALEYYCKTIEIYNVWVTGVDRYELIYDKIGDVYKLCGKYDQALEYYRKTIELYERKAKACRNGFEILELGFSYEKAAKFCESCGKQDTMVEFQNKSINVKELEERICNDRSDNLIFKFEITNILFENQMDDAAEYKSNGEDNEVLQCYENAFEILENEIKKWNKTENLKCLGELYDKLAIESEACGNKLMSKECHLKYLKITEYITKESDDGEQYYDFETKWQKVKID
jgi:tetratricopeptide (TPR) repeat protein